MISRYLSNIAGWQTKRKIVVIESDDWGSIRMPSLTVYENLKSFGVNISSGDNGRFNTLDTLETSEDLETLFSTLKGYKDNYGNHPSFTALSLCANPDFDRIAHENFAEYYYEPVTVTLDKYGRAGAFSLWRQGEQEGFFFPEFHGREHLNIKVWMDDLRASNEHTLKAFKMGFWGFRNQSQHGIPYQSAFDLDVEDSLVAQKEVIRTGLELFERLHERKATYFVPPNGAINEQIIDYAVDCGIKYVSSPKIHREPQGNGRTRTRHRYLGKSGYGGMIYLTRNCFFEPSYKGKGFSVADCLSQIQIAFLFRKPAIISTHRVNYIGGLNEENRTAGNRALGILLGNILKRWPDVEFMSSTKLADLIKTK